jgi:hypothetical protein
MFVTAYTSFRSLFLYQGLTLREAREKTQKGIEDWLGHPAPKAGASEKIDADKSP